MKSLALRIVDIAIVIVTVVMTFLSGVLLYYKTIGKDHLPTAVTSTYATTVTDPQTGDELSPFSKVFIKMKKALLDYK